MESWLPSIMWMGLIQSLKDLLKRSPLSKKQFCQQMAFGLELKQQLSCLTAHSVDFGFASSIIGWANFLKNLSLSLPPSLLLASSVYRHTSYWFYFSVEP